MNEPNDPKLKLAIAEMLTWDLLIHTGTDGKSKTIWWRHIDRLVLETEWLYIVWLAEEKLKREDWAVFCQVNEVLATKVLPPSDHIFHATFNQRATALIRAKATEPKTRE